MPLLFTDTFTGTANAAWSTTNWTTAVVGSGSTVQIGTSNRGRIITPNTVSTHAHARSTFASSTLSDFTITVTKDSALRPYTGYVGINMPDANPTYDSVRGTLYGAGGFAISNGAWVEFNGNVNNQVTLRSASGGTVTSATTNTAISWAAGAAYKVRIVTTATQVQAWVWPAANAMPGTATFTLTPAAMPPAGRAFVGVANPASGAGIGAFNGVHYDDASLTSNDVVNQDRIIIETPATASALAPQGHAATGGTGRLVNAVALSASAALVMPTVKGLANVTAPSMTATASSPDAVVKASTRFATTFENETAGLEPTGFTVADAGIYVRDLAGTFAGKALHTPSGYGEIYKTGITGSSVADVLVRSQGLYMGAMVNGQTVFATRNPFDFTPAIYVNDNYYATQSDYSQTHWLRVRIDGTALSVKAWTNGAGEPASWDAIVTVTAPNDFRIGLRGEGDGWIDYFAIDTTGGEAETYTQGKEIDAVALTATSMAMDASVATGNTQAAQALSATSVMVTPSLELTRGVIYEAQPMTAVADMQDSAVFTPDVTNFAGAMSAAAELPEPSVIGGTDVATFASAMTASAQMTEPDVSNQTDVTVVAATSRATATLVYYTEADDPFISIIKSKYTGQPVNINNVWLRFGQDSVGQLKNYASDALIGGWVGEPEFGIRDEYSRPATHFDADTYAIMEYANFLAATALSWEIVFKTDLPNGPLFSGEVPLSVTGERISEVRLVDGKVTMVGQGTANVRVDDGKWHHLLITIGSRGLEVFVDGISRLVRRPGQSGIFQGSGPLNAIPAERVGAGYDGSQFVGDILMFAQYGRELVREAGNRHYYAYLQATVVQAQPAGAIAGAGDSKGRGNRLRALGLYRSGGVRAADDSNWTGLERSRLLYQQGNVPNTAPFDLGPYTVFMQSYDPGYRNDYDYSPRYINLETDVPNVLDYDMVFFIDMPAPNEVKDDVQVTGQSYYMHNEYEKMIASVRWAVDQGLSLWCPQPELAQALGIIDGLDKHSLEKEPYDLRSWYEDSPAFKAQFSSPPSFYRDTHYNNKYRFTAQVDGFTDLGGVVISDLVHWVNDANPFSSTPDYWKWNLKDVSAGLRIGDELYFPTDIMDIAQTTQQRPPYLRRSVWSVPAGKYRGLAVAKEQATVTIGDSDLPNPFADNALTILLQPGDSLNGTPVGGKILVDFMSGYDTAGNVTEMPTVVRQVGPFGPANEFDGFDYDSRRRNATFSYLNYTQFSLLGTGTVSRDISLPTLAEFERFPIEAARQYPMLERGLNWLGQRVITEPGSVRVLAPGAEAHATVSSPSVVAAKRVTVSAAPAQALAQIVKPDEANDPDVQVVTLPLTASAAIVAPTRNIQVGAAQAVATMNDVAFEAGGEDFIFYIIQQDFILYIKEDN